MTDKLEKIKNLVDSEHYELAIDILNSLNGLSPREERYRLLLLSYSSYKIKKYNLAITMAEVLLQKNSNNEYASQLKYLSYVELKDYDSALDEIISFLSVNKANLYKITLEELLTDIKNGCINDKNISDKIKELALINNISL